MLLFLIPELILRILFTTEYDSEEMLITPQQEHILNQYYLSYGTHKKLK